MLIDNPVSQTLYFLLNKGRIFSAYIIVLILVTIFSLPVCAVANPDNITIHTAKAFENIWEDGDMLFVVSYDIEYASEPTEDAEYTFQVNLLDSTGATIYLSRAIEEYQYNVISIYATPAQVTALGLVYGSAYKIRVTGNPAFFASLVEDINMDTQSLSPEDWNTDGANSAIELLRLHCIDVADALESDWSVTLLTTTTEAEQVLNTTGSTTFLTAIPELNDAVPALFSLASGTANINPNTVNATYESATTIENKLGTSISDAFEGIGNFFGISETFAGGFWLLLLMLTTASIIFLNSGNSAGAMILTIPFVVMGAYLGVIPISLLYTLAILVIVYVFYFIWLRGT